MPAVTSLCPPAISTPTDSAAADASRHHPGQVIAGTNGGKKEGQHEGDRLGARRGKVVGRDEDGIPTEAGPGAQSGPL